MVATIGPTSEQKESLQRVVKEGMKIMRLNFSHATPEEVELRCTNLALAQEALYGDALKDTRAVLLDTKGPEIRTGKLANDDSGHATMQLNQGNTITLHTTPLEGGSTPDALYIDYKSLHKALAPGMHVLLDDGAITLTVQSIHGEKVICTVDNTGDLRSRAGVNLPFADTSDLPAMSDKDKADIRYGMQAADIDFVAASFVQTADGVKQIRGHIAECARELKWTKPLPLIISKIETSLALKNFDAILEVSDAIMVARGDLGVEIPLSQVTNAQKEMVAACNAVGKPVIVATQMLESMTKSPRPTRAEVSDVTNAVYDGCDATMTSGETAKGKYPDTTVRTMNEIIVASERYSAVAPFPVASSVCYAAESSKYAPMAHAVCKAALERDSVAILCVDAEMSPIIAACRPHIPVISFCSSSKQARQQQLYRAIFPVVDDTVTMENAVDRAAELGWVLKSDSLILVDGSTMKFV